MINNNQRHPKVDFNIEQKNNSFYVKDKNGVICGIYKTEANAKRAFSNISKKTKKHILKSIN